MTVGELKRILAREEDDTLILAWDGMSNPYIVKELTPCLWDGRDTYDFDESKIDPGHLQKALSF